MYYRDQWMKSMKSSNPNNKKLGYVLKAVKIDLKKYLLYFLT